MTTPTTSPFLAAALDYLNRGWPAMPILRTETKKPAIKWKELQTRLPEEEELRAWFTLTNRNIGVVTGEISGFFALDIDGEEGWRAIEAHGGLPPTVTTESRPGRQQMWFRHPGGRVANAVKFLPGLDLRGDGGYVQCPPSVHHSGTTYQWINHPDTVPFADAPAWLLEYTRKTEVELTTNSAPVHLANLNGHAPADHAQAYAWAALVGECEKIAAEPDGSKHGRLLKSAIALGGFVPCGAISAQEIEDNLYEAIAPRAKDKVGARETIRDGINYGIARPRDIPKSESQKAPILRGLAAHQYIEEAKQAAAAATTATESESEDTDVYTDDEAQAEAESEAAYDADTTTYAIQNGRIVYLNVRKQKDGGEDSNTGVVCDFAATITEQILPEDGPGLYRIEGRAARGGYFQAELSSDEFSDEKRLKARLQAAAGAQSPIRKGMMGHVGPAISLLTGRRLKTIRSYARSGWASETTNKDGSPTDGQEFFLLPGRGETLEAHNSILHLIDPPYFLDPEADLKRGQKALAALLEAQAPTMACVAAAFAFQAPLAYPAGWRNERYALFITGQTGSFKSSWAQVLMTLYGPDFLNDSALLKFGQGATINALAQISTLSHDMPLMVDNYKPNTGRGSSDFVNVVHNILEGAEKRRLDKNSRLMGAKPIYCWPLITGEDVPEEDAASLARILVVQFSWPKGEDNPNLTIAQDNAAHLCAVGRAWIDWLETAEGREAAATARRRFPDARSDWRAKLREKKLEMANPLRVASNLATNELTWWTMKQCPALAPIVDRFTDAHLSGLMEIAASMAGQTTEATEASKFLSVLRELLSTERAVIAPYGLPVKIEDRERLLGWRDNTNPKNILLIPNTAREKVLRVLGPNGLNGISKTALTRQLKQMGALAGCDAGRGTKKARADVSVPVSQDYLCINGDYLSPSRGGEDANDEDDDSSNHRGDNGLYYP